MYLGSDAVALAPFTDAGHLSGGRRLGRAVARRASRFRDLDGRPVERPRQRVPAGTFMVDKGNHRHFMAKEIYEQPEVVGRTLARYVDFTAGKVVLPDPLPFDFKALKRMSISACGTAYYAGLIAKYWFERLARLPVEIDVASEFRYREPPMEEGQLALFISQSGETADTLASLRYAKAQGQHVVTVVNVQTSTMARESAAIAPTLAGTEIGVASTKAFSCQLTVLALPRDRGRPRARHALRDGGGRARQRAHRGAGADGRRAEARARRSRC